MGKKTLIEFLFINNKLFWSQVFLDPYVMIAFCQSFKLTFISTKIGNCKQRPFKNMIGVSRLSGLTNKSLFELINLLTALYCFYHTPCCFIHNFHKLSHKVVWSPFVCSGIGFHSIVKWYMRYINIYFSIVLLISMLNINY